MRIRPVTYFGLKFSNLLMKVDVAESCSSQPGRDRIMPIPVPQGGGGGYGGGYGGGFGGYPFMMGRKKRDIGEAAQEEFSLDE